MAGRPNGEGGGRGPPGGGLEAHIEAAARSFDAELQAADYARIHHDDAQLGELIRLLSPRGGQRFLDLGTGGGYVANALARACPESAVVGLDVAPVVIEKNAATAAAAGPGNLSFRHFDGLDLPFPDAYFHGIVSRYAFHHFPRPHDTLDEIARTLDPGGRVVLSDPIRDEADDTNFINAFQALKLDGHVCMHRRDAFLGLVAAHGFEPAESFGNAITFTRERDPDYEALLAVTPARVLDAYAVVERGTAIEVTFEILNTLFLRPAG